MYYIYMKEFDFALYHKELENDAKILNVLNLEIEKEKKKKKKTMKDIFIVINKKKRTK